jgi:hypothetical protein
MREMSPSRPADHLYMAQTPGLGANTGHFGQTFPPVPCKPLFQFRAGCAGSIVYGFSLVYAVGVDTGREPIRIALNVSAGLRIVISAILVVDRDSA